MTDADLFNAGLERHRAGEIEAAAKHYEAALAIAPEHVDALNLLGLALHQRGRDVEAAVLLERAVALQPGFAGAWLHLGGVLRKLGRPADAARAYAKVAEIAPGSALGPMGLGQIAELADDRIGARAHYLEALRREPGHATANFAIGALLAGDGDLRGGLARVRRAIELDPGAPDPHAALATILFMSGDAAGAIAAFQRCLALAPGHVDAWASLVAAHCTRQDPDAARAALEAMAGQAPANDPRLDVARGQVANLRGEVGAAIVHLSRALRNMAGSGPGVALAEAARALGANHRAFDAIARVRLATACDLLGTLLPMFDDYAAADALFEAAALLGRAAALKNRIAVSLYDPSLSLGRRHALHLGFAEGVRGGIDVPRAPWVRPAGGRIRVGYLSSDFRHHPVARSMRPLFDHADRSRFSVHGYNLAFAEDAVSREFAAHADGWRHVAARPDAEIAAAIREDGIDILVHVAGHFDENRLAIAWHRAAPVQVSLFDAATSGIPAIDHLIADRRLVPRGGDERYAERVFRLPNLYIHPWMIEARALSPRPGGAPIVFASFSNPVKLNGAALTTWARILRAIDGSTLLLGHARAMGDPEVAARLRSHFSDTGVDPARLIVRPFVADQAAHLASYQDVDVVLDPFPFNGSTSCFEALSMGVPVISLRGDTMMSRWSAAMLDALGLGRCRTGDPAAYVAAAAEVALDRAWREELRAVLPGRLRNSALVDGKRWMRRLERAYAAFARKAARDRA